MSEENKFNHQEQPAGEALPPAELDAITQAAVSARANNNPIDTTVINKVKQEFEAGHQEEVKASTSGAEPRLPSMNQIAELRNIDRSQLEKTGTTVLHDDVTVGTKGDANYVPPAPIDDSVSPEFQQITQKELSAREKLEAQATARREALKEDPYATTSNDTSGVVIENVESKPFDPVKAALPPETFGDLSKYMDNMEADMIAGKAIRDTMAEVNPNLRPIDSDKPTKRVSATEAPIEVQEKRAEEAMVVINKFEEGNIVFTEEEQAKIEEAKVIRVNEVKNVNLATIKKRRDKKPDVRQAIRKKGNTMRVTQVLLPASGFTVEMLGCSPYEIMTLQQEEDPIADNQIRWNLIWSKVKSTSIKIKNFEEFYNKVAADDYEVLIWGILRSTFEDVDTINLNCTNPKCVKSDGSPQSYDYKYSVTQLLRPEFITEEINANMKRIISANTLDAAIEAHNLAPINTVETFELPESGYVVEMSIRSANDFVNKTLSSLASESLEPQYRQAAILATSINEILIPDEPGNPNTEYFSYDTPDDITEIIYNLAVNDLLVISHKASEVNNDISFKFGFTDLECPKCGTFTKFQPMDISTILFYHNAQSMNVSVE